MKVKVRLFAPFDADVGKREAVVELRASDLTAALREIAAFLPGLDAHLFTDGNVTEHVNVFVNGKGVFHEEFAKTRVKDGDEIVLMPPITGG